jgi:hypothetical protein
VIVAAFRCAAGGVGGRLWLLGQIVFEHDEDLPLVAVGVFDPGLVLRGVAAVGLHFVAGEEAALVPLLADSQHVGGRCDLDAEMGEGAGIVEGVLVKSEVEGRVGYVELGVAGANLGGLDAEELAVERDALGNVANVEGEVRFERQSGHGRPPPICGVANILLSLISVNANILIA